MSIRHPLAGKTMNVTSGPYAGAVATIEGYAIDILGDVITRTLSIIRASRDVPGAILYVKIDGLGKLVFEVDLGDEVLSGSA